MNKKIHRNILYAALFAATYFFMINAYAWDVFGPSDYESCLKKSAQDAKSKDALQVLTGQCAAEFPGRKSPTGGYVYFDYVTLEWIPVSGPKLSKEDNKKILDYQAAKAKATQDAAAKQSSKNNSALRAMEIVKWNISCENNYYCIPKVVTAVIKNRSNYTISKLGVGIISARKIDACGALSETTNSEVNIQPGNIGTVRFYSYEGPENGSYQSCFMLTSAVAQ